MNGNNFVNTIITYFTYFIIFPYRIQPPFFFQVGFFEKNIEKGCFFATVYDKIKKIVDIFKQGVDQHDNRTNPTRH